MASAGVQAVDGFFVLSGFVIAHVCATKETSAQSYFVSRAARMYSVAIPALIFIAIIDSLGLAVDATTYAGEFQEFSPGLIVRSVLFLGEMWNAHRYPGSDGPYWSLGFEVWYYVAFGIFTFVPGRWRWPATAAVLAIIGPKVAVMFPAWLVGVAAYNLSRRKVVSRWAGWLIFLASLALLAAYQMSHLSSSQQFLPFSLSAARLMGAAQDYFLAMLFAMNIVGFVAISDGVDILPSRYGTIIRWLAGGTFSIYLVHLPIMHFIAAISPWTRSSPWTLMLLLIATPIACRLFAEISERRKDVWHNLILAFCKAIMRLKVQARPALRNRGLKDANVVRAGAPAMDGGRKGGETAAGG